MVTQHEIEQWLQEGISAAKAGYPQYARSRLLDVVEVDQTNETAWYWLYQLFDESHDKRVCLENLITINPTNAWAKQELARFLVPALPPPAKPGEPVPAAYHVVEPAVVSTPTLARSTTLKLVTAFWLGLSLMCIGGGAIGTGEWFISGLRTRTIPGQVTALQAFELLVALVFVIGGLMVLNIAALLFVRSIAGFYGSVILALGLLLIGPVLSLIIDPPSYLAMTCLGGMAGMIMLLTLASQPDFRDGSSPHG